jgi:hypothetical protein
MAARHRVAKEAIMADYRAGQTVKWGGAGRRVAGEGAFSRMETTGKGRGKKTFVVAKKADGSEIRLFPGQVTPA